MNVEYYAFGEVLWDCLPSGRHIGGAPFNVAADLTQMGCAAGLISAVGQDPAGDEILRIAGEKRVSTRYVTRAREGLSTGMVTGKIDRSGNATYEIMEPAAWDEIAVPEEAREAVASARALVFGSLAMRSPANASQLSRLLELEGPLKFFDLNLRPPFVNPEQIMEFARRADMMKLNDEEAGRLVSWLETGELGGEIPRDRDSLAACCGKLVEATHVDRVCITRGGSGAALWSKGEIVFVPAPRVEVRDTVGAGDAFMAGLVRGVTAGAETERVLAEACRIGAFVASHHGATPVFPPELREKF